ncbi:MAG: hypothetical protein K2G26_05080 [Clostridia bacterium]|nr:hypothetical protein [Clostridia bacterium]
MTKTKKIVALLAVFAMGATAAAGVAMSRNFSSSAAFADTGVEDEVTVAGSADNPVKAVEGVNTIEHMVVDGDAEWGYFKELVYYMTFTPANSGVYSFTHSNPDVGVDQIYSETQYPDGEWDDSWTVYSAELTANVEYTLIVKNFDWMVDLTDYEVGSEYELTPAETITIAYASAAEGSTWETAIPYTVGETIYVAQGHDAVWYSFEATGTDYYLIALGGSAAAYEEFIGDLDELSTVTSNYDTFKSNDVVYICVTPSAESNAEVQVLVKDEQSDGSCIVETIEIGKGETQVGDGKWYTYTAGENEKVTLTGNVDVYVYAGYNSIGGLYEGKEIELTAGVTYNFFAPAYTGYDEETGESYPLYGTLTIS